MYDIAALKAGIEQIDKNIATFEDAIRKEEETKREYKRLIRELEAQEIERGASDLSSSESKADNRS
jgi:GrpB-like predicted nucleotidyltransferase (UPF0157 family)